MWCYNGYLLEIEQEESNHVAMRTDNESFPSCMIKKWCLILHIK